MDEIISYKMCPVIVRNAKLQNYLNIKLVGLIIFIYLFQSQSRSANIFKTNRQYSNENLICLLQIGVFINSN
jgi:hypothetical protein